MDDELEEIHFKRVLNAFSSFSTRMNNKLLKQFDDWNRLNPNDQEIIPEYLDKLNLIKETFEINQKFFDTIASYTVGSQAINEDLDYGCDLRLRPTDRDYENLRSTLRQLVREWSDEGSVERSACFNPILTCLKDNFDIDANIDIKVLVPGAGLGRLAWEINRLGFAVQGNEFSLYMLLSSQLILNSSFERHQFAINPFAFPLSNHLSAENSLRLVRIPDVTPDTGQEHSGDFSMTAGDFIEVYSRTEELSSWDCVVTCFFLDTAQNVLEYLRTIFGALKPGGLWINLGPLQYHFESAPEMSIELTWNEVVAATERIGFKFEEKLVLDDLMAYSHDNLGLSRTMYRAVFSAARKPPCE
jgi:carnosine N-methyltransferase